MFYRSDFSVEEYRKKLIKIAKDIREEQTRKRNNGSNYPMTETGDDREAQTLEIIAQDLVMVETQEREVSYWDYD